MKDQQLPINVIATSWHENAPTLQAIRETVFIKEQQVTPDLEWDEHDEKATHFLAFNDQNEPVGTARLIATGQIGRMAVLPQYRHQGFGAALLRKAIREAQKQGMTEVMLFAQTQALTFYEKFGFKPHGDEFMDAGILHRQMSLELLPSAKGELTQHGLPDLTGMDAPVLGETKKSFLLDSLEQFTTMAAYLAKQVRLQVRILSYDLEPLIYDHEPFIEALSTLARSNKRAQVQILIQDTALIRERGHRLINVAQRLSSNMSIKKCNPKYPIPEALYMIVDEDGLLYRKNIETYAGFANCCYPSKCKELGHDFDYLWAHSLTDPDLMSFLI